MPSFTFPVPALSPPLPTRLLKAATDIGTAAAAAALRSYKLVTEIEDLPGACIAGPAFRLPTGVLEKANNIIAHDQKPMPMQMIYMEARDAQADTMLLIFTDRSALVACTAPDDPEGREHWDVLPVVLKLGSKAKARTRSRAWDLSVQADTDGRARLKLETASGDDLDLFDNRTWAGSALSDFPVIQDALCEEALAWGQILPDAPRIILPAPDAPRTGYLGRDMPAPHADLDGAAYHWPAALAWANVAQDGAAEMDRSLHLAFVAVHDEMHAIASDFAIAVVTPPPSQAVDTRPIGLEIKAIPSRAAADRGLSKKAVVREIERIFRRQLRHPAMPGDIDTWRAYRAVYTNKAETRTKLVGLSFFQGRCGQDLSGHDRMAAFARFGEHDAS